MRVKPGSMQELIRDIDEEIERERIMTEHALGDSEETSKKGARILTMFGDFETFVDNGYHKAFMFIIKHDDVIFENFNLNNRLLFTKLIEQIFNTYKD